MSISVIVIIAIVFGVIIGVIAYWATEWVVAGIGAGIVGVIVCGLIVFGVSAGYTNPRDLACTVTNTDRAKTDSGSDMRVYTKECGVLHVQDLLWGGEFNSADTFALIHPNHTYKFHVTGIRVGFFSVFPNIRSAQEVS